MKWIENFNKVRKYFSAIAVLFIVFTHALDIDIHKPTSCPTSLNATAKSICCQNLNAIRRPFLQCCWYPMLVIWRWQYDLCAAQCKDDLSSYSSTNYRCCVLPCCFRYLKVIGQNPVKEGVLMDGLFYSFYMSVYNDSRWKDPIVTSVTEAYNKHYKPAANMTGVTEPSKIKAYEEFWDCFELIPNYLYDIIDLSYNLNYLRCPLFNTTIEGCELTRKFVQDCFIDYAEVHTEDDNKKD